MQKGKGDSKKVRGASPMDTALAYLTTRARTVREMELHLDASHYGEYEVYQAVERLKELGYLNDAQYAEDFVRSRLATKPVSRKRLREQLYAHKLGAEDIEAGLALVSDEMERENAVATAEKFCRQFAALDADARRNRVLGRLAARGYAYDVIRDSVARVIGDFGAEEYAADEAGEDQA